MGWIDDVDELPLSRQCELAEVARATVYRRKGKTEPDTRTKDLLLCRLIDEEYTSRPFYGSRRMVVFLRGQGHVVNRKRVQRLMREMGLAGMAPGPATSIKHPKHKVYPYLLRGVAVTRPNQVWSTDVTYIRLARGFAYLVAIIDWYSRCVLSWRISNSMDASFCVDCLEDALREHGRPEVFNSDQGSQFTSHAFTDVLKRAGVAISMDGRGRALDNIFVERLWRNVKHEDVVCYERDGSKVEPLRCFIKDEGGPLGVDLQEQASNHHKLRGLRARVVSVDGKGGAGLRQVRVRKTNVSELLMTCRNVLTEVETGILTSIPRQRLGANLLVAQLASGMKAA